MVFERLWTRSRRGSHLTDRELLQFVTLGQDRASLPIQDAPGLEMGQQVVEHLAVCNACRHRIDQQQTALDDLASATRDNLDELFSASRLERQVATVMRRLDGKRVRGRVLPFPAPAAARLRPVNPARRWTAVAAAAGLFLGLLTGQFVSFGQRADRAESDAVDAAAARPGPVAESQSPRRLPETIDDGEAFLVEVDTALTSLRSPELRALDDLTPRVSATFVSANLNR